MTKKPVGDPRSLVADLILAHQEDILTAYLGRKTTISERYAQIPDETIRESGKKYLELGAHGLRTKDFKPLFWSIKESVDERLASGVSALEVIKATRAWRDVILAAIRPEFKTAAFHNEAVELIYRLFDDILGWIYGLSWENLLDTITGLSQYRTMVTQLQEMVLILDVDGAIVFANPHVQAVLGYGEGELRGRELFRLLPEALRKDAQERLVAMAGTAGVKFESVLTAKTGEEIPVHISTAPLLEGDEAVAILGVFTDLREQKRLQDEVRRAEYQMAVLLRTTNDAVVMTDLEGRITVWNKGAEVIFGYRPGEVIGEPLKTIVPTDRLVEADAVVRRVVGGSSLRLYDMDMLTKEGMRITVSTTVNAIPNAKGEPSGVGLIIRDVTDKRRIERELRESQADLERAMEKLRQHNIALEEDNVRLKQLVEIQPVVERTSPTDPQFTLLSKFCYIVMGEPELAFRVFADLVTHGHQGLCLSRSIPDRVRKRWDLEKTPIVWLTSNRVEGIHCVPPSGIAELSSTIVSFIEKTTRGVVLIDGLEYLVSQNSFKTILHLLQLLNDKVMLSSSSLLISLDPMTLEERDLHMLQRELVLVEPKENAPAAHAAAGMQPGAGHA